MSAAQKPKWKAPEMTPARAVEINSRVCAWVREAARARVSASGGDAGGATFWGFEPRTETPTEKLSDLVRARWTLLKEQREGRFPRGKTIMSETLIASLVTLRDAPTGLPLLMSNGRALAVAAHA
jgi:hypothetical protein